MGGSPPPPPSSSHLCRIRPQQEALAPPGEAVQGSVPPKPPQSWGKPSPLSFLCPHSPSEESGSPKQQKPKQVRMNPSPPPQVLAFPRDWDAPRPTPGWDQVLPHGAQPQLGAEIWDPPLPCASFQSPSPSLRRAHEVGSLFLISALIKPFG